MNVCGSVGQCQAKLSGGGWCIYICVYCVPDEGPKAGDDGDGRDGLEHGVEDAVVGWWITGGQGQSWSWRGPADVYSVNS